MIKKLDRNNSRYTKDLECECGRAKYVINKYAYKILGYTVDENGYCMLVLICNHCFEEFRFHAFGKIQNEKMYIEKIKERLQERGE